jgi:hypothetical protein
MFFAITAIVVSAIQILIGVAIGLAVVKHRRREVVVEPPRPPARLPFAANERRHEKAPVERPATLAGEVEADVSPLAEILLSPRRSGDNSPPDDAGEPQSEEDDSLFAPPPDAAPPPVMPSGRERRVATRRAFDYRQFVAPYHGGALPGKASFREVECQDISSTGFSFLSSQVPDFDSLVVALGVAPYLTYVRAQIVNRFQVDDGLAPLYRIGCRFAEQVN